MANKHLRYLSYVLRHKWYVFLACWKLNVPLWSAIWHDWDKFLPSMWSAYVDYFHGEKIEDHDHAKIWDEKTHSNVYRMIIPPEVQARFDAAWNGHQKRNRHHWQYWLLANDQPKPNFTFASHDGGMTHIYVSNYSFPGANKDVAIVYDADVPNWTPDVTLVRQFEVELRRVPQALLMPDKDRREMLADWIGAGRALGFPNTAKWYGEHRDNINLHPETRKWVEDTLISLGLS